MCTYNTLQYNTCNVQYVNKIFDIGYMNTVSIFIIIITIIIIIIIVLL